MMKNDGRYQWRRELPGDFNSCKTVTVQFWKTHHAVLVSFGHLPEAHAIMNGINLPETEQLRKIPLHSMPQYDILLRC